jgi:hypothetical protein
MDPFIIGSLEQIDVMAMGINDPEHIKVRVQSKHVVVCMYLGAADLQHYQAVCRAVELVRTEGLAHGPSSQQGVDAEVAARFSFF